MTVTDMICASGATVPDGIPVKTCEIPGRIFVIVPMIAGMLLRKGKTGTEMCMPVGLYAKGRELLCEVSPRLFYSSGI